MTRPLGPRWALGLLLAVVFLLVAVASARPATASVSVDGCDFNGDGYGDIFLPVPGEGVAGSKDAGAVNVLYGSTSGISSSGDILLDQNSDGVPNRAENDDRFGQAVACGDLNGDGYTDLAVGVPGEKLLGHKAAGGVDIVYGSPAGLGEVAGGFWSAKSPGVAGPLTSGALFGAALATCDFDGDGFDDLAIGAPGDKVGGEPAAGVVHILYGSSSGIRKKGAERYDQSTPKVPGVVRGGEAFGHAITCGDFDGDSHPDLAVGAPFDRIAGVRDTGSVVVIWGAASGTMPAGALRYIQGSGGIGGKTEIGDSFGFALASGDFNGDTLVDLAIGAPREAVGLKQDAGAIVVVSGDAGRDPSPDSLYRTRKGSGIEGDAARGDLFGWSLAAGDFDNDGKDDLAVGSPGQKVSSSIASGAINVLFGRKSSLTGRQETLLDLKSDGIGWKSETGANFGWAVAAVDPRGSGNNDLLAFAPGATVGSAKDAGVADLIRGGKSRFDSPKSVVLFQDKAGIRGQSKGGDELGRSPGQCDALAFTGCGHSVCPIGPGQPKGTLPILGGTTSPWGSGTLRTYSIQVESGLKIDPNCFAEAVRAILSDPRSWIGSGEVSFKRIAVAGANLQIILASPAKVDQLCYPLATGGVLSCRVGAKVVINALRWRLGVPDFHGDMRSYQGYLINHEVGHGLGQSHRFCPGVGQLAPVMMQQSKGVGVCVANAWPRPYELSSLNLTPGSLPPGGPVD